MKFLSVLLAVFMSFAVQAQDTGMILPNGKLIIIGGGDIPDTLFNLFAASIGGKDQPIVVIPTATSDEAYIREGGHLKKFSTRGFTNLHTIHTRDKKLADDQALIDLMRKAKGLYFGGGDQDLIAQAYANTQLHREMFALLERGGVIMGTSAGATIMGSLLIGGDHREAAFAQVALAAAHEAVDAGRAVISGARDAISSLVRSIRRSSLGIREFS